VAPALAVTPAAAPAPAPAAAVVSLEQVLPTLDPDLGFVGLADMDTLPATQVTVRVKGRLGTPLHLRLNGQRVPESRVGRTVSATGIGLEAWESVGLPLHPGVNLLEWAPPHSAGRVALRVVAPAEPARLSFSGPHALPADGHTETWLSL